MLLNDPSVFQNISSKYGICYVTNRIRDDFHGKEAASFVNNINNENEIDKLLSTSPLIQESATTYVESSDIFESAAVNQFVGIEQLVVDPKKSRRKVTSAFNQL